jgi:hypothetical protein
MIAPDGFHQEKIGEKQHWCPKPKPKTPMKKIDEYVIKRLVVALKGRRDISILFSVELILYQSRQA